MKLLNTKDIGERNLNGDIFERITSWAPYSTKKYDKIYEIKHMNKKFLPAKFNWMLTAKKIKYGD